MIICEHCKSRVLDIPRYAAKGSRKKEYNYCYKCDTCGKEFWTTSTDTRKVMMMT